MTISPLILLLSVRAVLGAVIADRVQEAMARRWPEATTLTLEQAGSLLAASMLGSDPALDEVPGCLFLTGAIAEGGNQEPLLLTPDQAQTHPLTRDWLAETAGDAVAVVLAAVAARVDMAPGRSGVPLFSEFEVYAVPGSACQAYGATLTGVFRDTPQGEIAVTLTFGSDGSVALLKEAISLSGSALAEMMRQLLVASRPEVFASIIKAGNQAVRAAGGTPPFADEPELPTVGIAAVELMGEEAASQLCEIIGDSNAEIEKGDARRTVAQALLRGCHVIPGPRAAQ